MHTVPELSIAAVLDEEQWVVDIAGALLTAGLTLQLEPWWLLLMICLSYNGWAMYALARLCLCCCTVLVLSGCRPASLASSWEKGGKASTPLPPTEPSVGPPAPMREAGICLYTMLPEGIYGLPPGHGVDAPRFLRMVVVKGSCLMPVRPQGTPPHLVRVEQHDKLLKIALDKKKRCDESTVARFTEESTAIRLLLSTESRCGAEGKVIAKGNLLPIKAEGAGPEKLALLPMTDDELEAYVLCKSSCVVRLPLTSRAIAAVNKRKDQLKERKLVVEKRDVLATLRKITWIQHLEIHYQKSLDLALLSKLTELRSLYVDSASLSTLWIVGGFTKLQKLELHGHGVEQLAFLEKLTQLEHLYLQNMEEVADTDLSAIADLSKLRYLSLAGWHGAKDISDIQKLKALETLRLESLPHSALSGLRNHPALKEMELRDLQLPQGSFLTTLPALWRLSLHWVTNLAEISKLRTITSLTIKNEKLRKLPRLHRLRQLNSLDLSNCRELSDINGIAGLPKLTVLDLSRTNVTNLNVLRTLPKLWSLSLVMTRVKDLSSLVGITSLRKVRVNNPCTDPRLQKLRKDHPLLWVTKEYHDQCWKKIRSNRKRLPKLEDVSW